MANKKEDIKRFTVRGEALGPTAMKKLQSLVISLTKSGYIKSDIPTSISGYAKKYKVSQAIARSDFVFEWTRLLQAKINKDTTRARNVKAKNPYIVSDADLNYVTQTNYLKSRPYQIYDIFAMRIQTLQNILDPEAGRIKLTKEEKAAIESHKKITLDTKIPVSKEAKKRAMAQKAGTAEPSVQTKSLAVVAYSNLKRAIYQSDWDGAAIAIDLIPISDVLAFWKEKANIVDFAFEYRTDDDKTSSGNEKRLLRALFAYVGPDKEKKMRKAIIAEKGEDYLTGV